MSAIDPPTHSDRLAVRPREASAMLGISERTLWSLTKNGDVPCIRAGRVKLYSLEALREWLAARASKRIAE
jgi:excisionase family DNA binding protein